LSVILLQLKLTKVKLEVLKFDFKHKKKDMKTYKLEINWQHFAQVCFYNTETLLKYGAFILCDNRSRFFDFN